MSIFVELNKTERLLARMMEKDIKISLGVSTEEDETVSGIREGAKLAVGKVLNLYPNMSHMGFDLISKKYQTVNLVLAKKKANYYYIKPPMADIYVLVYTEKGDSYEVVGFAKKESIVDTPNNEHHLYDHVFQSFIEDNTYPQIINGDWKNG